MMSSNRYQYIEEIYDSEEDEIYISEDEQIFELENDFDFETNPNNHYYYYDSNKTIFKLKQSFDQKIRQIKKQLKFIEQTIELTIHESIEQLNEESIDELTEESIEEFAKESNESNDSYLIEDNINNNAINCCQIIDLNKDNTFGHQLSQSLDSKAERTYNELKKVFDYALDDLECEQIFDFDEVSLSLVLILMILFQIN